MNRFLRPISVIALLQEMVIFSSVMVTGTIIRSMARIGVEGSPQPASLLRNFWLVFALIPLVWVVLAVFDEDSAEPRLGERQHFWIGVGILILLAVFGLSAIRSTYEWVDWGIGGVE